MNAPSDFNKVIVSHYEMFSSLSISFDNSGYLRFKTGTELLSLLIDRVRWKRGKAGFYFRISRGNTDKWEKLR